MEKPKKHPTCGPCVNSLVCKFHGAPRMSIGEMQRGIKSGSFEACSFYRCGAGDLEATKRIRSAPRTSTTMDEGIVNGKVKPVLKMVFWEEKEVDKGKVPVLRVTTFDRGTRLKTGFVTHKGEWVVEHPEGSSQLWRTGQKLKPEHIESLQRDIEKGLLKFKLDKYLES